jgi:hypothetical protein
MHSAPEPSATTRVAVRDQMEHAAERRIVLWPLQQGQIQIFRDLHVGDEDETGGPQKRQDCSAMKNTKSVLYIMRAPGGRLLGPKSENSLQDFAEESTQAVGLICKVANLAELTQISESLAYESAVD